MAQYIPFWDELVARDLKQSADFNEKNFTLQATELKETPLAWHSADKTQSFTHPITLNGYERGSIRVTPTTSLCMCHSRFAIRILNERKEVIWHKHDVAQGSVAIALVDSNQGGSHEILLRASDHGRNRTTHLITPNHPPRN